MGLDINQIIKNLSGFYEVDISNKNNLHQILDKYDVNKNSIFDNEELQNIANDLHSFAKQDDNQNDLSEEEGKAFLNSLLSKTNSKYLKKAANNSLNFISKLFDNVYTTGVEQRFTEYIEMSFHDEQIEEKKQQLNYLLKFTKNDKHLSQGEILSCLRLDDKTFKQAMKILQKEDRIADINASEAATLAKLNEDEYNTYIDLVNNENLKGKFEPYEIAEFAKLRPEELEIAKGFFDSEFDAQNILELSKLNPEQQEREDRRL